MALNESLKAGFFRKNFKERLKSKLKKGLITLTLLVSLSGGMSHAQTKPPENPDTLITNTFQKVDSLMKAADDYAKAGDRKKAIEVLDLLIGIGQQLKDETIVKAAVAKRNEINIIQYDVNSGMTSKDGKKYFYVYVTCNDKASGEDIARKHLEDEFKKKGKKPDIMIHTEDLPNGKFKTTALAQD